MHLSHGLFLTWTHNLIIYRSCITVFTHQTMLNLTQPRAPCYPLFTYLENQLLCLWCEYPSTLVPGLLTTAPPFASSPTLSHPTDQVTIFTQTTSTTPAVLVGHRFCLIFFYCQKCFYVLSVKYFQWQWGTFFHLISLLCSFNKLIWDFFY